MNYKIAVAFALLAACGVKKENQEKAPWASAAKLTKASQVVAGVWRVDTSLSVVRWRGTKMMGTGQHTGSVRLSSGQIVLDHGKPVGGEVVVDLTTISITDIPAHDPVPRRNLTRHLNKDFATDKFPAAVFKMTGVEARPDAFLAVQGELTIRGVTRQITAPVEVSTDAGKVSLKSNFSISRSAWGIGEDGSWLAKKLVDDEIYLEVDIVALPGKETRN